MSADEARVADAAEPLLRRRHGGGCALAIAGRVSAEPARTPLERALAAAAALVWLALPLSGRLSFDDAYMYSSLNLRQGGGLAWNPGGAPTFGLTSRLQVLVALPFSLLSTTFSLAPGSTLQIASWLTGLTCVTLVLVAPRPAGAPRRGILLAAGARISSDVSVSRTIAPSCSIGDRRHILS